MSEELAKKEIAMYETLKSRRLTWDSRWQRILEWVTPHKAFVTEKPMDSPPSLVHRAKIHDTTGIFACNTLADGHMSAIVPRGQKWMRLDAPEDVTKDTPGSDAIKNWYADCSPIFLSELSKSNFYPTIYSVFRDRSGPGTGAMYVMPGERNSLAFIYMPIGSYSVTENEEGEIDTVYREFEFTAVQARGKWDEDKLPKEINECYTRALEGHEESLHKKWKFIHGVQPNRGRDPKKIDVQNMEWHSRYTSYDCKKVIEDGGLPEFPFVISRFEKWGDEPYGFSPAYNALPNILTANYLIKLLKALGELKVSPRVVSLANEKAQIDLRAGGQSVVSKEAAAMGLPREWATAGDFELGQWLIEYERKVIKEFFFTELFKMFSGLNESSLANMTAEVARGLKSEGLLLLAPSFTQFSVDMQPGMETVFNILFREGKFPPPPQELLEHFSNGDGTATIPPPKIAYLSKVAMALQEMEDESNDLVLAAAGQAAQFYPDILDNLDLDEWIRNKSRIKGVSPELLRELKEVEKMRAERQAMMAQQAALNQAQQVADTAATASKADPSKLNEMIPAA